MMRVGEQSLVPPLPPKPRPQSPNVSDDERCMWGIQRIQVNEKLYSTMCVVTVIWPKIQPG